ncbi:MAG: hypothetical protein ABI461_24420 [Polyangiaceae bacterium]
MANLVKSSKARAESLLDTIESRKREIGRAFYDLGTALRELHEKKLYGALGYESFDAMLNDRGVMSPAQARKLVEVVRSFQRDAAERLGAEKAYALARYVARTKQDDDVGELIASGFPVGGRRKSIDVVTVRQIAHATQVAVLKQKGQYGENARAKDRADIIARKIEAKLRKKTDDAATVAVVYHHGSWWLKLQLPAEMAEAVFA